MNRSFYDKNVEYGKVGYYIMSRNDYSDQKFSIDNDISEA